MSCAEEWCSLLAFGMFLGGQGLFHAADVRLMQLQRLRVPQQPSACSILSLAQGDGSKKAVHNCCCTEGAVYMHHGCNSTET